MKLLPNAIRTAPKGGPAARLRLSTAVGGTLALALALFAGRAAAGAGDYPSPLYLAGGASTLVTTSFQLVGGPPPATPGTPTAAVAGAGVLTGAYTYLYTVQSGAGGFAASATSSSVTLSSQAGLVGNLPTGITVDIYRQKSATGLFYRVAHLVANGSSTFTDNVSDAAAAGNQALPQADNRIATLFSSTCAATTCGYIDFSPGVAPATTGMTTPPTLAASPSATPNNKGWIVDGAGGVTIPAGTWTFQVRTKNSNLNGVAYLIVGLWKVTTSGGAVAGSTTILAPSCTGVGTPAGCPGSAQNGTNIVTAANSVQTIAHSVSLPSISLAAGEHIYVQFWRRQTTSYSSGGAGNRLATMIAYDGLAQISHPAASTFPNDPTLQTPAAGVRTNSSTLTATFSDPDAGDTGTVGFQVCSDSACSSVVASGSSASVANGANANWTPALLGDGSYYWRAQATDAAGGLSNWSAIRSFTLDRTAPSLPGLQSPANGVLLNALPALTALLSDPDAGDTGAVSFKVCADSACSSVVASGSASGAANGSSLSWTPGALADGTYFWQAQAADAAGNQSSWTAPRTFTLDMTPPHTAVSDGPANLTNNTSAFFRFNANEAGSSFQCSLDGAAFAACPSPTSYSGLADGSHSFQVRAIDAAGNTDPTPAGRNWIVDTTPPETTISDGPADPTNSISASFGFSSNEAGSSFQCSLDGADVAACASPQSYSGLADGSHSFQVRATDAAGNTDPTPAGRSWIVDTTPPETTINVGPANLSNTSAATFSFTSSEAGSGFQCSLDGADFAACASPQSYGGLADGRHSFQVRATDAAGNTDPMPADSSWTVDTTPPAAPGGFVGIVTKGQVKLRWTAPADNGPMRNYVLYIDGVRSLVLDGEAGEVKLGKFNPDDGRVFAVAAVDEAGNEGPRTGTLVGVPNLIGLKIPEAAAALAARGLVIGSESNAVAKAASAIVVAQTPATPAVASTGSTVALVVRDHAAPKAGAPLLMKVRLIEVSSDRDVACGPNGHLSLRLELSANAAVTVRFLTASGGPLASRLLGSVRAGATSLTLPLPPSVSRPGVYRVVVTATTKTQVASAEVRLTLPRSGTQSVDRPVVCRAR